MAIIDFFDRGWRINPKGTAYVMDDRAFSFTEIGELSCRIANALLAAGFPKETKAAVWAANHPIAWTCVLGLWRAGLAWVPVNPRSSLEENCFVLDSFDAEVVFFQKYFAAAVEATKAKLPKVRQWVCIEEPAIGSPSLDDFVAGHPSTPPDVRCDGDDVVAARVRQSIQYGCE